MKSALFYLVTFSLYTSFVFASRTLTLPPIRFMNISGGYMKVSGIWSGCSASDTPVLAGTPPFTFNQGTKLVTTNIIISLQNLESISQTVTFTVNKESFLTMGHSQGSLTESPSVIYDKFVYFNNSQVVTTLTIPGNSLEEVNLSTVCSSRSCSFYGPNGTIKGSGMNPNLRVVVPNAEPEHICLQLSGNISLNLAVSESKGALTGGVHLFHHRQQGYSTRIHVDTRYNILDGKPF